MSGPVGGLVARQAGGSADRPPAAGGGVEFVIDGEKPAAVGLDAVC
jgi:hypothetical protein